jgi:hypothetical protein
MKFSIQYFLSVLGSSIWSMWPTHCNFWALCIWNYTLINGRSQRPHDLRRRSAAARLLSLWVRIPPRAWNSVCCECCLLSGRGLCDELITRPEESYRLWCVVVCDTETSWMRRPWPTGGCFVKKGCFVKNKQMFLVRISHLQTQMFDRSI